MSVVDAPLGRDFAGPAVGEFRARRGPRRLARFVFVICIFDALATFALASRRIYAPGSTLLFLGPMVCMSMAFVGFAVRSAVVRIEVSGIFWGWGEIGFRMGVDKIATLHFYHRGLAVQRKRGSPWYLASHDWERFDQVPNACQKAGLFFERREGRAPLRAQMQAYGAVLDGLMVITLLSSALLLAFAAVR